MNLKLLDRTRESTELIGWLWHSYMKRHTPKIAAAFVFMAIQGGMLGLLSYMIQFVFDDVLGPGDGGRLLAIGAAVLIIFSIRGLSGFIQRVIMMSIGARMQYDLQAAVMRHALSLDPAFFEANPPGQLIARINGDTRAILASWSGMLAPCIRDSVAIISLFVAAILIDWQWTLLALVGVPLIGLPVVLFQKFLKRISMTSAAIQADIVIRLDEIFHGIRTVKLYSIVEEQFQRFRRTARKALSLAVRIEASIAAVPAMVDVIAGFGFLVVMVVAGSDVIEGKRTLGEFMSFFTAAVLLFDPVKRLGGLAASWQVMNVSIGRVKTLLEAQPMITDAAEGAGPAAAVKDHGIEFRNVSLSFGDNRVVSGVSFRAEAGGTTALVGRSGVGKTTIFNLLTRMVDPDGGSIEIGGVDLKDIRIGDLRGMISVVAQDSGIFDESIRENIVLGRRDATEEEFLAAARAAYVHEFAESLPEGYDTPCGPRGASISGGQRQRVAIARALLKDSPILLLDEPTSSLDSRSENLIQEAVAALSRRRTILVIAHRFATVRDADRILVMDEGRIVDQGTHDELMGRGGLYSLLYTTQLASAGTDAA